MTLTYRSGVSSTLTDQILSDWCGYRDQDVYRSYCMDVCRVGLAEWRTIRDEHLHGHHKWGQYHHLAVNTTADVLLGSLGSGLYIWCAGITVRSMFAIDLKGIANGQFYVRPCLPMSRQSVHPPLSSTTRRRALARRMWAVGILAALNPRP